MLTLVQINSHQSTHLDCSSPLTSGPHAAAIYRSLSVSTSHTRLASAVPSDPPTLPDPAPRRRHTYRPCYLTQITGGKNDIFKSRSFNVINGASKGRSSNTLCSSLLAARRRRSPENFRSHETLLPSLSDLDLVCDPDLLHDPSHDTELGPQPFLRADLIPGPSYDPAQLMKEKEVVHKRYRKEAEAAKMMEGLETAMKDLSSSCKACAQRRCWTWKAGVPVTGAMLPDMEGWCHYLQCTWKPNFHKPAFLRCI
ncbi:hypothetical protein ACS0TY_015545 [Phlomoides rotata]